MVDRTAVQTAVRVATVVFVVAWLFVEALREVVPFWLPFAVLLAAEVEFVVRAVARSRFHAGGGSLRARRTRPRLRRARRGGGRLPLHPAADASSPQSRTQAPPGSAVWRRFSSCSSSRRADRGDVEVALGR